MSLLGSCSVLANSVVSTVRQRTVGCNLADSGFCSTSMDLSSSATVHEQGRALHVSMRRRVASHRAQTQEVLVQPVVHRACIRELAGPGGELGDVPRS